VRNLLNGLLFAAVAAATAATVSAHFKLISPASWIVEDMRGDPQKIAPCGGTMADAGTPTNAMTKVQGGQKLHIEVDETIFHPGHYRIALARTRAGLPPDPEVTMQQTEKGPRSVSAAIAAKPQPPVLVDGLWPHTERPAAKWTTDVDIPNLSCEKCTLQIIEFMANHPGVQEGGFSYHHCADLQITADPSQSIDKRW
jgi:hypothetical protein